MHGDRAFGLMPIIPEMQRMTTPLIEKPYNARYSRFSMICNTAVNLNAQSCERP